MTHQFSIGQTIEFDYPTENSIFEVPTYKRRRFCIQWIRDLQDNPLDTTTLRRQPCLQRSRYLLRGWDMTIHQWRSFYDSEMQEVTPFDGPLFRLALYDPLEPLSSLEFVGSVFTDSEEDQRDAVRLLAEFTRALEETESQVKVGLFRYETSQLHP